MERNISNNDLINNPQARLPVCLCLDVSPSMMGAPISELNRGVATFFSELQRDPRARYHAEVAVIAFSGKAWALQDDFVTLANVQEPPVLEVDLQNGGTSIGQGTRLALDLLEARKQKYKTSGVEYYQPWLLIMTDGQPTDDSHLQTAPVIAKMVRDGKLTVIPVGIGEQADPATLKLFSPNGAALRLNGLKFQEFFRFLVQSAKKVTASKGKYVLEWGLGQATGFGERL